jgi:DNA-binding GntR family transcriptional regulator
LQHHFHTPELAQKTIRDHAAIAKAIAGHDPDAARAALHRHLGRVVREFQRGVTAAPQPVVQRSPKALVNAIRRQTVR